MPFPWVPERNCLSTYIWDKVSKNGPSKNCGREPLKKLKGYGQLKQTISLQMFLSHMISMISIQLSNLTN